MAHKDDAESVQRRQAARDAILGVARKAGTVISFDTRIGSARYAITGTFYGLDSGGVTLTDATLDGQPAMGERKSVNVALVYIQPESVKAIPSDKSTGAGSGNGKGRGKTTDA